MKRPTCQTCPFWDDNDGWSSLTKDESETLEEYKKRAIEEYDYACECHRYPPNSPNRTDIVRVYGSDWPVRHLYDWCGEHPDFPEYIASLKTPGPDNAGPG